MSRIDLTPADVERVRAYVTAMREAQARTGWRTRYEPDHGTLEQAQMRGYGAEMAVAKALGVEWSPTVRGGRQQRPGQQWHRVEVMPDVGAKVQVRSTRAADRPTLHVRLNEPEDHAYVLVLTLDEDGTRFETLGWCWGYETGRIGRWTDAKGGAYMVAAADLRPMRTLPRSVVTGEED